MGVTSQLLAKTLSGVLSILLGWRVMRRRYQVAVLLSGIDDLMFSQVCISTTPTEDDDNLSAFPVTMKIKTCMEECCVFGF